MPQIQLFTLTFTASTVISPLDCSNNVVTSCFNMHTPPPNKSYHQESSDFVKTRIKLGYLTVPATPAPCSSNSADMLCPTISEESAWKALHPDISMLLSSTSFSVSYSRLLREASLHFLPKISTPVPHELMCFLSALLSFL